MGELSPEEISMTEVSYEPGASAVILVAYADSKFMSQLFETSHFRRMKILSDAGKEYGDIRIRYYRGDKGYEEIYGVKAQITQFQNGKPQVSKVEKEYIFDVDLGEGWRELRITFPNVQVGSILEYTFRKSDKRIEFLDAWTFQNTLPTIFSKYQVTMLPQLEYKTIGQGLNFFTKSDKYVNNGTYAWTIRDLYSLKEEPLMKNYRDYVDRIDFQLSRYMTENSMSGPVWKDFLSSWEKLGNELIEYYSMKGFYRTNPVEKETLNMDFSGDSETEKAKKAYYFIRDNFINEGEDWIYTNQTLNQLLKSRKGAPGELILAYMGLLRSLGITCDPVLIGSKGYGRSNLVPFPFLNQFDEILLLANLDGKIQYLDLSDRHAPFGYVDLDKHVSAGLLLQKNQSKPINLDIRHASNEVVFSEVTLDPETGELLMNYTIRSFHYEGLKKVHIEEGFKKSQKPLEEMFAKSTSEYKLKSVQIENLLEDKNFTNIKFQLTQENMAEQDLLVFNPLKFSNFSTNPFTQDFRVFPVDFGYAYSQSITANVKIPDGYEIEDYPTDEILTIEGSPIGFYFQTEDLGGIFKVSAKIDIRQPLIHVDQYSDLKFLMESIATKLSAPIVLKKVSNP